MINISTDLGSIYSSLDLRLDKFESSVAKALQGFYKLQTGTEKSSSIMDKSVNTAVSNISKSYELWERANERTGKSVFDNSEKINSLKAQMKLLDDEINKSEKTLADMENQCGKNSKEVEEYKSHVLDLKTSHADLTDELKKAEKETGTFAGRLQLLEKEFDKIDNRYKVFDKIGGSVQSVGNQITTGVTLPIVGIGAAATKVGMDFDAQMSRVQAISGATGEELKKLDNQALQLGQDTAFSAKQAAEGMENLASAGFSTNEIMQAMPGMLDLAASSGEDLANSADIAASTLRGFGLVASDAGHVADVLAKNAADTNAAVADTGEAMKYIAPVAHAMGLSLEEVTSAIGEMSNAGIKGTQAGTTLRAALTRLADPSKESAKAMKQLSFDAFDSQGKLLPLNRIIENLQQSTKGLTDKQKEQAISTIFGQEAMSGMLTLIQAGPDELNKLTNSFKNSDGAAKEMAKTMQNNAKSAVEQMKGSLETAAIKIEKSLAPSIISVTKGIGDLADKFSNLSPETQEWIIKIALATATVGPFLSVTGGAVKGLGELLALGPKIGIFFGLFKGAEVATSTVAGTAVATGVMTKGITLMSIATKVGALALNPWVLGIGTASAVGYGLYKVLNQQATPAVNLFADKVEVSGQKVQASNGRIQQSMNTTTIKISEATKQAVGAYMNLDKQAEKSLQSLYVNGTEISNNTSNNMVKTYTQMGNTIKTGMDKKYNEQVKSMQDFFSKSKGITTKEQQAILKGLQDSNNKRKSEIDKAEKEIQSILNKASSEKRSLKLDEVNKISKLQENMKTNAVKTLSKEEIESKVILERLKSYNGRITAEQASDTIKNAEKQRKSAVDKANQQYHDTVANIIKMRDETHTITADQATKLIAEAERQRKEAVKKADDQKIQVVEKVTSMNKSVADDVDTKTGEILTNWDKLKKWWEDWKPSIKKFFFDPPTATSAHISSGYSSTSNTNKPYTIGKPYASGTDSATPGLHEIAENGFEIVTNRQFRLFGGGEKVFNHEQSQKLIDALTKSKDSAENIANEAIAQAKESITVKPRISVSESTIKSNDAKILSHGTSNRKEYQDYISFVNKLNQDEVKTAKDLLDKDYKNRIANIAAKEKAIKDSVNKEIASLRDSGTKKNGYNKAEIEAIKVKETAQINSLEKSKTALKNYDTLALDLLNKRSGTVKKAAETSENLFNDKINTYDEAIKRLSIDTGDLKKNLENQQAIVIIQEKKIDDLKNRYEELAISFGSTSDEAVNTKKAFEEAKTELIDMTNAVDDAKQKIIDAQKEADSEIADSINDMVSRVKGALKERYDAELEAQENTINAELSNLDKWKDESINRITDVYDAKIKTLDDQLKAEEKAEQDATELKNISSFQSQLAYEHNEFNKEEIQKQLNKAIQDREKRLHQDQIEEQKQKLEEQKQSEIDSINTIYEANKQTLENQLENYRKFYNERTKDAALQAEAEKMIMNNNQAEIITLLHSYEADYEQAGQSLGEKLVAGFKPKIDEIKSMIASIQDSFDEARTSALNSMALASSTGSIINSTDIGSGTNGSDTSNLTTNNKTIINNNNVTYQSPKALLPSEMLRATTSLLTSLAFKWK